MCSLVCAWLVPFGTCFLRLSHVAVYCAQSTLCVAECCPVAGCFTIFSLVDRHLNCFQFEVIMAQATQNIHVEIFI